MRDALAAVVDVVMAGALAFAAFRLAVAVAPCSDLGECTPLGPSVLLLILAAIAVYFGAGYLLLGTTFGRYLAGRDARRRGL